VKLCDDSIERNAGQQRAYRLFFWALITYSVALCLSLALLRHYHAWPGRPVFMVLPLIGVILILRSMMLYFSAADEMQRRILSEASAYTLAATIFLTVVFGFFEGTLVPAIPWWLRFTFMMSIWGFAVSFAQAKYR
jgi:hypothetical protein